MHKTLIATLIVATAMLGLVAPLAAQTATVEFFDGIYALDCSADGSVMVGNRQGNYETFRWTEESGIVFLGRSTFDVLGVGAGGPKVSADGTRVSATILGDDRTYATQGRWTLGVGWEEMMPPVPADGGLLDQAYGSAWGISGDGETVVGLYWRPGQTGGLAHASAWNAASGVMDLGSGGGNSRANAASYDGSVVVGWDENPDFGTWWPCVWRDGIRTVLDTPNLFCLANAVNDDGTIIGGVTVDPTTESRNAALWYWNGSDYDLQIIGVLDGTQPGDYGQAIPYGITPDGHVVVGYNQFAFNPGESSGFVWTPENGMVDAVDFLADLGVTLPASYKLQSLTAISDDGTVIVGNGIYLTPPYDAASVRIVIETTTDVPTTRTGLELGAAYPNPFNPQTRIPLTLREASRATLVVYDAAGRAVRTLHRGSLAAGSHVFTWNGCDDAGQAMPSGVYLARLQDGRGEVASQRMTLMK